jgi:hypothetical protein
VSTPVLSNLDFGGIARGVNHPDPVNPQDIATRAYVLAIAAINQAGNFAWTGTHSFAAAATFRQFLFGNQQIEAGALPLNITLNADTSYLTVTTAGDGEIRTISGSTLGRVVFMHLWNFGTKTLKFNVNPGTSSSLITPGLIDCKAGVRDSFILFGQGTDGWLVMPTSVGIERIGNANMVPMAARRALGRADGAGTGVPQYLTGVQLGAIVRFDNAIGDNTTTGTVATYTIAEGINQVTFNGVTNVIHGFSPPAEPGQLLIVRHIGAGQTTLVHGSSTTPSANNQMLIADGLPADTHAMVLGFGGGHNQCNTALFVYTGSRWYRVQDAIALGTIVNAFMANMAAGTVKLRALGSGTGAPIDGSGAQLGELVRRIASVVDSAVTGSVATYAIAETTTQVRFTGSAAATIHGMTATSATFGKTVTFHVEAGSAAAITFAHESGSAGAAGERNRTPSGAAIVLKADETVEATYYDNRWRFGPVARAAAFARVRINGGSDFVRGRINLLAGPGATLAATDDAANDEVDVLLSGTGENTANAGLLSQTNSTTTMSCGGVISRDANTMVVGETWRFVAHWEFVHTAAATPLIECSLDILGSTSTTFQITPIATAGTYQGTFEALVQVRSLGSSGTVQVTIRTVNPVGNSDALKLGGAQQMVTVNTTVLRTFSMAARMVTTVASNTLSILAAYAERIK